MKLKKILLCFIFMFINFFCFSEFVVAKEVNVYMFYGKTCPHCEEALEYLNHIKDKYDLNIIKYEVWFDKENKQKLEDITDYLDITVSGVPFVIINNTPITGYSSGVTDETYKYHIKLAAKDSFVDKVGIELGVVDEKLYGDSSIAEIKNNDFKINFLMIKSINLKKLSPFISSLLLGLKDGLNTYSLEILFILLLAIVGLKDKRKIILLGATYIVFLGIIHLGLMISSLDFSKLINFITALKTIIAFSLVIIGAIKLNIFINGLDNKKIENKSNIKFFLQRKSFIFMIIATVILSVFSVLISFSYGTNLSEVFITLFSNLNDTNYLLCILIYMIFFILFSFIVYLIFSILIIKISKTKSYSKYSKLVSGMLLLLIGILLLLKPELFIGL